MSETKTYLAPLQTVSQGPIAPSPCSRACPVGINVKAYVSYIAMGRFDEALRTIYERNPLPSLCGRLCLRPCEAACLRSEKDEPIAIRSLKGFVCDIALRCGSERVAERLGVRPERVAVVGAGPAGLTAAHDLAALGYGVTLWEAEDKAGGLPAQVVPEFRLSLEAYDADIRRILGLGVELRTGQRLGRNLDLKTVFSDGAEAVIVAVGAQSGQKVPGLDPGARHPSGLWDGMDFLKCFRSGPAPEINGSVLVVGGGSLAICAARAALRLGASEVRILYSRPVDFLPADPEEIEEALAEGVAIEGRMRPVELLEQEGRVTGLQCLEAADWRREPSGRHRRVAGDRDAQRRFEAGAVILAAGRTVASTLLSAQGLALGPLGNLLVDPVTLATNIDRVFGAGDAATTAKGVIDAMATGRRAARSVHRLLSGEDQTPWDRDPWPFLRSALGAPSKGDRGKALDLVGRPAGDRPRTLLNGDAVDEARRCLMCGPCEECEKCSPVCAFVWHAPDSGMADPVRAEVGAIEGLVPAVASVDTDRCVGCGWCEEVCPYRVPRVSVFVTGFRKSRIDPATCRGCGLCVGACPAAALDQGVHATRALERKGIGAFTR